MPMICHNCGAIYPAAGICPRCFPMAGTKSQTVEEIQRDTQRLYAILLRASLPQDDLEQNGPDRGIVEGQDES